MPSTAVVRASRTTSPAPVQALTAMVETTVPIAAAAGYRLRPLGPGLGTPQKAGLVSIVARSTPTDAVAMPVPASAPAPTRLVVGPKGVAQFVP